MKKSSRDVESILPDHDNGPCFCKIILCSANASHSLGIPAHFVEAHLPKLMPSSRAVLRGPSGDCWSVTICQEEGNTIIQHGWQQFFLDHCLGDKELLLFRHNGNMCFDVQIFGKSGCERKHVSITRKLQDSATEIKEEEEADIIEIGEIEAPVKTRRNGKRKSIEEKNPGSSSRKQCQTG